MLFYYSLQVISRLGPAFQAGFWWC